METRKCIRTSVARALSELRDALIRERSERNGFACGIVQWRLYLSAQQRSMIDSVIAVCII